MHLRPSVAEAKRNREIANTVSTGESIAHGGGRNVVVDCHRTVSKIEVGQKLHTHQEV